MKALQKIRGYFALGVPHIVVLCIVALLVSMVPKTSEVTSRYEVLDRLTVKGSENATCVEKASRYEYLDRLKAERAHVTCPEFYPHSDRSHIMPTRPAIGVKQSNADGSSVQLNKSVCSFSLSVCMHVQWVFRQRRAPHLYISLSLFTRMYSGYFANGVPHLYANNSG